MPETQEPFIGESEPPREVTMLEKAARALLSATPSRVPGIPQLEWDEVGARSKEVRMTIARAVLEAIREPDEAMRKALLCDGPYDTEHSAVPWKWAWQTAIDAILNEEPGT